MATIHFEQQTRLTPQQYIAGLTDFGPGRSKVFSNSADDYLNVAIVRRGKNAKGRLIALVLGSVGKGVLKKSFVNSVRAIEARNNGAPDR